MNSTIEFTMKLVDEFIDSHQLDINCLKLITDIVSDDEFRYKYSFEIDEIVYEYYPPDKYSMFNFTINNIFFSVAVEKGKLFIIAENISKGESIPEVFETTINSVITHLDKYKYLCEEYDCMPYVYYYE